MVQQKSNCWILNQVLLIFFFTFKHAIVERENYYMVVISKEKHYIILIGLKFNPDN